LANARARIFQHSPRTFCSMVNLKILESHRETDTDGLQWRWYRGVNRGRDSNRNRGEPTEPNQTELNLWASDRVVRRWRARHVLISAAALKYPKDTFRWSRTSAHSRHICGQLRCRRRQLVWQRGKHNRSTDLPRLLPFWMFIFTRRVGSDRAGVISMGQMRDGCRWFQWRATICRLKWLVYLHPTRCHRVCPALDKYLGLF